MKWFLIVLILIAAGDDGIPDRRVGGGTRLAQVTLSRLGTSHNA